MVDFGLVAKYKDDDGNHIAQGTSDLFKGSMLFASKYIFQFQKSSRRDDLISLVYNLIFMLDPSRMTFINGLSDKDKMERLKLIGEAKAKMTVVDLCGESLKDTIAYVLYPFVQEVMSYSFEQEPNYDKLRFLLEAVLLR